MTLVDRFICRRDGHVPVFADITTSGMTVTSYITSCQRCGKAIEVPLVQVNEPGKPKKGA